MKFCKEKFSENMSMFKYGKEGLKDDILYVTGKVKTYKDVDFLDLWDGNFEENLATVFEDNFYKTDGNYVYLKSEVSLLSIFAMPFRLFSVIFMRAIALFVMLVATPFVVASSVIISE